MPDHYMTLTESAKSTITGSIRACPEVPKGVTRRYCYLEGQKVRGDDYEVVDSWSDESQMEV
jgi:hypothetical protein